MELIIPNRITWLVNLDKSDSELFSEEIVKRIALDKYQNVTMSIENSNLINTIFFPFYKRLIMGRSDFRLDVATTINKFDEMSKDLSYKLIIFKIDEILIGGVIIHFLSNKASIAYRCFDHEITKKLKLRDFDYFADYKIHETCRKNGYTVLSHGNDRHPVNQIGLSIFKMRVGAKPYVAQVFENIEVTKEMIFNSLTQNKTFGYYSDPIEGCYTQFHLYGEINELTKSFEKIAERARIIVVRENVSN